MCIYPGEYALVMERPCHDSKREPLAADDPQIPPFLLKAFIHAGFNVKA